MLRILTASVFGGIITLLVFWFMQWLVQPAQAPQGQASASLGVDFIRELRDSSSETKTRELEPPEPPRQPAVPEAPQVLENKAVSPNAILNSPGMGQALASFKSLGMGNVLGGYSVGDSDVMPLVQIEPVYPPQALARKLEGIVVLRMQIDATGSVEDVAVIRAEPKGIFEREAIRAAYRYKFKPKLVDGKPMPQVATLPFEFKLEKK